MGSDHIEIRVIPPPPVQQIERLINEPSPDLANQKVTPDDLLLMGMMVYMQEGLVLDWLTPEHKPEEKEEEKEKGQE